MSSTTHAHVSAAARAGDTSSPAHRAYQILHLGFTVAPILAGVDKFFNMLTQWDQYVPAFVSTTLGGNTHAFMMVVGVIEVVAGIGVAVKPRIFSYVVAGWLGAIIVNLLLIPGFFDIALRDFGLLLGALALGQLSAVYARR